MKKVREKRTDKEQMGKPNKINLVKEWILSSVETNKTFHNILEIVIELYQLDGLSYLLVFPRSLFTNNHNVKWWRHIIFFVLIQQFILWDLVDWTFAALFSWQQNYGKMSFCSGFVNKKFSCFLKLKAITFYLYIKRYVTLLTEAKEERN